MHCSIFKYPCVSDEPTAAGLHRATKSWSLLILYEQEFLGTVHGLTSVPFQIDISAGAREAGAPAGARHCRIVPIRIFAPELH